MEHNMPINDVRHAWTEERTYATNEGVGKFTVYVGVCTCGTRFEGRDSGQVTSQYMSHLEHLRG